MTKLIIIIFVLFSLQALSDSGDKYGNSRATRDYKQFNDALEDELNKLKKNYAKDLTERYKNELDIYYIKEIMDYTVVVLKLEDEVSKISSNNLQNLKEINDILEKSNSLLSPSDYALANSIHYNQKMNNIRLKAVINDDVRLKKQVETMCRPEQISFVKEQFRPKAMFDSDIKYIFQYEIIDEKHMGLEHLYYLTGNIFRSSNLRRLRKEIKREFWLRRGIFELKTRTMSKLQKVSKTHVVSVCNKNKIKITEDIVNGSVLMTLRDVINRVQNSLYTLEIKIEDVQQLISLKKISEDILRNSYYERLKQEFSVMVNHIFKEKYNYKEKVKKFVVSNFQIPLQQLKIANNLKAKIEAYKQVNLLIHEGDVTFLDDLNQVHSEDDRNGNEWLNIRSNIKKKVDELW